MMIVIMKYDNDDDEALYGILLLVSQWIFFKHLGDKLILKTENHHTYQYTL